MPLYAAAATDVAPFATVTNTAGRAACYSLPRMHCRSFSTATCRSHVLRYNSALDKVGKPYSADWALEPICSRPTSVHRSLDDSYRSMIRIPMRPLKIGKYGHLS